MDTNGHNLPGYYLPGQVINYGRKSFAQAKERHVKSLEDQFAACDEIREENGLPPTSEGENFEEARNHGGDEWWRSYPERGLIAMHSDRTRSVLTDLMLGVVEGRILVICCWSTDRIHRDVGIAQAFINLLIKHKVRFFDRTGEIPINHPDAEAAYLNAAVSAQHFRKQCAVNSPRGIKRSAKKGILVTDANILGFRGGEGSLAPSSICPTSRTKSTNFMIAASQAQPSTKRPTVLWPKVTSGRMICMRNAPLSATSTQSTSSTPSRSKPSSRTRAILVNKRNLVSSGIALPTWWTASGPSCPSKSGRPFRR